MQVIPVLHGETEARAKGQGWGLGPGPHPGLLHQFAPLLLHGPGPCPWYPVWFTAGVDFAPMGHWAISGDILDAMIGC